MTEKRQGRLSTRVRFAIEKVELTRLAKGFSTLDLLLDWLFPISKQATPKDRDDTVAKRKSIADRMGEWPDWVPGSVGPKPGKSGEIFQAVVDQFRLQDKTTHIQLMECDLAKYLELLTDGNHQEYEKVYRSASERVQRLLKGETEAGKSLKTAKGHNSGIHHHNLAQGLHVIHYDLGTDFDIGKAVDNRNVDQKYLYIEKYAAEGWNARIAFSGSKYPYHRYCTESLNAFIGAGANPRAEWSKLVADGKICTTVMLGAGSPDKDVIILDSFERSPAYNSGNCRLNHLVLDTSMNMLTGTAKGICESAKGARRHPHHYEFLDLITVCADFDNLKQVWEKISSENVMLRRVDSNVAFFVPGLTFTNINETRFLDELDKVIRPGDILVIGVEFIDPADKDFSNTVKGHYAPDAVYELFIPSIFWLLEDDERKHVVNSPKSDVIRIDPINDNAYQRFLKHVMGIRVTAETGTRSIQLASSRRYIESEFIALLEDRGFVPLGEFAAGSTTYRQAAFRRT